MGGGQVDQPAFAEDVDPAAVGEDVLVDELADRRLVAAGELVELVEGELDVEVARVADHRAVLHRGEVLGADDVDVAGDGDEQVADLGGLVHRHDLEAVHRGLEGADRLDLGDDHVGAQALGPHGDALAAPAVAGDDDPLAGDQHVGGADHAVDRALAGPVAVVEEVLGHRVVDGDDRQLQDAVLLHRPEPDDAGGRLLHARDDVADEALRSAGLSVAGPAADLGVDVVEPVQGDEDHRR